MGRRRARSRRTSSATSSSLWLWHEADSANGTIATESAGDVTIYIDRSLELDCAYGQTGRDVLEGDGPSRMPEAPDALRSGKVPRKAGLIADVNRQQYAFTLAAESLAALAQAKLPDVEEADSPRVLFEERIALLRDLCRGIDAVYATFLKLRASSNWEGYISQVRRWIKKAEKAVAA